MTEQHVLPISLDFKLIGKRALQGGGIACILLIIFITIIWFTSDGDARFGAWVLSPLCTMSITGMGGGIFFYLMNLLPLKGGWQRVSINIFCSLAFLFSMWLSLVFGLSLVGLWS